MYLSYWQIILRQVVTDYKGCNKMLTRVIHSVSALQLEFPGPYGLKGFHSFETEGKRGCGSAAVPGA